MSRVVNAALPMAPESLQAFLARVQSDRNLQEKLKAAATASDVVAIAESVGFQISADAVTAAHTSTLKLSAEELESVSGGGGGTMWLVSNCPPNC